ncbi:hypothetical protein [Cesiribacter sp. SM1]|uniref:hypothetical protein n=1 Tax=Cesiribacter sp. SM1 TaxID=2861196 RepID=UPI001CD61AE9|nr:hypothetical protein [Cesiribacter sp. SM1]
MKISINLLLLASFVTFMSCSDGNSKQEGATPGTAPVTTAPANAGPLNPPHGQPGHRCDIEVGAPLNTPAAPNLPMPNLAPLPVQGTVAPGTNPPHGQPGHDCGLPVGAPLNK